MTGEVVDHCAGENPSNALTVVQWDDWRNHGDFGWLHYEVRPGRYIPQLPSSSQTAPEKSWLQVVTHNLAPGSAVQAHSQNTDAIIGSGISTCLVVNRGGRPELVKDGRRQRRRLLREGIDITYQPINLY